MADELEPVRQTFEADVAEYEAAIEEAAATAQEFAGANEEARLAVDGVRDSAAEAAAAVDVYRDAAGRWRNSAGQFATSAELEAAALGHERDEALEAEVAMRQLRDSSAEAALSQDEMRNRLAEVAAAAGITRDEMGKLHDAQGKIVGDSVLTGLALGHERDEALEAAAAFKKLRDAVAEADIAKSGGGLLSSLFGGGGGGGGSSIPLIGTLIDSPELIAGLLPLIMGAVTEVGALASGFTAVALGVGAFAVLAIPFFQQVTGAIGDTKAQLDKLPWPIQQTVIELKNVKTQFDGMSKAMSPIVSNLFSQAIGIISDHMGILLPLAQAVAPAISGVLTMLNNGLNSQAFKNFMGYMEKLSGPAITAIGSGMAGLAKDVMHLLTVMSQKDVINGINIAFRIIGFTIQLVTGLIMEAMISWDWITQKALPAIAHAFDVTRHAIATFGHDVRVIFDTVRHDIASWGHDIAHAFDTVRHDIATAGHDIAVAFDTVRHAASTFGHDIVAGLNAVGSWIQSNWKNILGWLLLPVLMAAGEIYTHTHQIAQAFDRLRHDVAAILAGARHDIAAAFDGMRHDVAAILAGARHDIASAFDGARHDISGFADWVPHEIAHLWDEARHNAASALAGARHDVATAFDDIRHATAAGIDNVLSYFERLPGEVVSFLASLPGAMLSIGQNIIHGLINGIESQGGVLANAILSLIPSPIRSLVEGALGMLSPSKVFHGYGINIVQGLINGVKEMQPHLKAAMTGLAGGVTATGSSLAAGAIAPASGSTSMHVTVPVTIQGSAAGAQSPEYLQGLQAAVQEAVLRYNQMNPGNGLNATWGRR